MPRSPSDYVAVSLRHQADSSSMFEDGRGGAVCVCVCACVSVTAPCEDGDTLQWDALVECVRVGAPTTETFRRTFEGKYLGRPALMYAVCVVCIRMCKCVFVCL